MASIRGEMFLAALTQFIFLGSPALVAVASFSVYTLAGGQLTAERLARAFQSLVDLDYYSFLPVLFE